MPPRRSHTKSKDGCARCKRRKIKCDEVHPVCGGCSKHGVSCDFSGATSPVRKSSVISMITPTTEGPLDTPSPVSPGSSASRYQRRPSDQLKSSAANRAFELRLMHHYTAVTAHTLSESKSQQHAWAMDIPALAYDCRYLMDAILAVSALHLRVLNPDDSEVRHASHSYMSSALNHYSAALKEGIMEQNAETLFATAALIAFQASASRCLEAECDGGEATYNLPTAWFHSFQGIKTVVISSWKWLRESIPVHPIIVGQPPLALDLDPGRHSFFQFLLQDMEEDVEKLPSDVREETVRAYRHATAFLDWAHRTPRRPHILGFAATVGRRFVQLISEQDPRALVMIACFFAMTKVVDNTWWLTGVARKEVKGIYNLLPESWYHRMEWPMTVACWEGDMDEQIWGVPLDGMGPGEDTPELGSKRSVIEHIDMLANLMVTSAPDVD